MLAFFLPHKQEDRTYGIEYKEIAVSSTNTMASKLVCIFHLQNKVVVSPLDRDTTAGCIGLQAGDVIHFIGGVKDADKFTLTKIKDKEQFVKMLTQIKESPTTIGLILVTERSLSSLV